MATLKFKEASPYTRKRPESPPEDYLFSKYLENISLESTSNKDPLLNVAIFGLGRAGTIHLENMLRNPRTKILYIVEDMESKWVPLKKHWHLHEVTFLTSKQSDRVFKDPNVDIAVVTSPTITHEYFVSNCLKAKKAVFCEKPIALDDNSIIKCYEMARKVGKPLFCGFNRRFDPTFLAIRDRIHKGDVGHVHVIKSTSRNSPLASIEYLSISGNVFHDTMVHDIDLMIWVLGEYPEKVSVAAQCHIPEIKALNDYDTVVATLYFPSGTIGIIDVSRHCSYGNDMRLEAFGPKGMIDANNEGPIQSITLYNGLQGSQKAPIWYSFPSRFKVAFNEELEHFLDVVVGKRDLPINAKDILAVNKIASACEDSARSGRVVELQWKEDVNGDVKQPE